MAAGDRKFESAASGFGGGGGGGGAPAPRSQEVDPAETATWPDETGPRGDTVGSLNAQVCGPSISLLQPAR